MISHKADQETQCCEHGETKGRYSLEEVPFNSSKSTVGPRRGCHYGEGRFQDCRIVDPESLPAQFPTHRHQGSFWESLGRAVATFGFLEEVLGKAIFSFAATKPYDPSEIEAALEKWSTRLERALTDPLGKLIGEYEKAVREHPNANVEDLDYLLCCLRAASRIRNALCHGSWQEPDSQGASIPLFVDYNGAVFDTAVDCAFLDEVQQHGAELSCAVVNSVTRMGWQFPGSSGPGKPVTGD